MPSITVIIFSQFANICSINRVIQEENENSYFSFMHIVIVISKVSDNVRCNVCNQLFIESKIPLGLVGGLFPVTSMIIHWCTVGNLYSSSTVSMTSLNYRVSIISPGICIRHPLITHSEVHFFSHEIIYYFSISLIYNMYINMLSSLEIHYQPVKVI